MSVEHEKDSDGALGKGGVIDGLAEKIFPATLIGPALSQIGLTIGDQAKYFRIKNLLRLSDRLGKVIEEKNLDKNSLQKLSLSVGLPLLEKASYQDDAVLQQNWANLLASGMEKSEKRDNEFSLDITYVEILH